MKARLAAAGAALWLGLAGIAAAQTLTVSAAASLAEAVREIARQFEATRPGARVVLNTGASGLLVQQIIQGAPVDVFISADSETVDRGVAAKALDGATRRVIASNTLVLVVPAGSALPLHDLAALNGARVGRIGIGKPASVPAGRYAQQVLQGAALWQPLQPRLVLADNVRQVLDYVARGEVEAGFVYASDAQLMKGKVRVAVTTTGHRAIGYPAVVVAATRQRALAEAFITHLLSAPAQALLEAQGLAPPPPR